MILADCPDVVVSPLPEVECENLHFILSALDVIPHVRGLVRTKMVMFSADFSFISQAVRKTTDVVIVLV